MDDWKADIHAPARPGDADEIGAVTRSQGELVVDEADRSFGTVPARSVRLMVGVPEGAHDGSTEAGNGVASASVTPAQVPGVNGLLGLTVGVVVIAGLFFAKDVLIPITLAVLLWFVLWLLLQGRFSAVEETNRRCHPTLARSAIT